MVLLIKKETKVHLEVFFSNGDWIEDLFLVKKRFFFLIFLIGFRCLVLLESHLISNFLPNFLDHFLVLDGEISRDEIKRAVWNCDFDKFPGPDDFTFEFF